MKTLIGLFEKKTKKEVCKDEENAKPKDKEKEKTQTARKKTWVKLKTGLYGWRLLKAPKTNPKLQIVDENPDKNENENDFSITISVPIQEHLYTNNLESGNSGKEKVDCGTSHGRKNSKNSEKSAAQNYHLLIGDTFKPTNRGKRKLEVESFDQSERSGFNKRVRGIGGNWTRSSGGNE